MKENSIEEIIKQLELILKVRKEQKEIIECAGGSCMNCNPDIKALSESIDILSDYKRVLKENEEKTTILLAGAEKVKQLEKENKKLKEDRNNNNKMVALARNEVLNYMTGYEDGKKHKMTATAQVVENQQYYIIQKQMEKYEEHIKRLQKENEKLKNEVMEKDLEIIGKEEYTKASMKEIIEQYYTANEECILIQKVKDKIRKNEEIIDISNDGDLIHELYQKNKVYEELLESEK